jgi:16S rRNA (guanine966-N2)-methyltransferase
MRIIAGEARGKKLVSPMDRTSRPPLDQIRKSLFSILEGRYEGRPVLDLFAGVGAFGLEAASRGASHVVLVERAAQAVSALQTNVENLGFLGRCSVIAGDAFRGPDLAAVPPPGFALVFLDPPFPFFYDDAGRKRIGTRLQELLGSGALAPDAVIVVRQPRRCREALPVPVAETRRYGASVVCLIEAAEAGTSIPVDGGSV